MTALRSWLNRPIGDHDRRRAFAMAAGVLLLAGAVLSITAPSPGGSPVAHELAPNVPAQAIGPRPSTPRTTSPPPPALEVARRFLRGYVSHLHGAGGAHEIRGASAALRRRLIARPVRVSPGTRRRRPRIAGLDGQAISSGWLVSATIATSGGMSYPIALVLTRRSGRVVVTRVVED